MSISATLSLLELHCPLDDQSFWMVFFCRHWVARLWKYFEFQSPYVAQSPFDLWNHNLFSLYTKAEISFFNFCIRKFCLVHNASFLASANSFLFSFNVFLMLPKWSLSHLFSSRPHLSIFWMTLAVGSSTSLASQIASTTSEHVWSDSHASLNLKGLEIDWSSRPAISIHSGPWSKDSDLRWWTFVPANLKSQSLVAKAKSNLSHIE